MADVFISYARADQALAADLARDLTARGYTVWWDTELVGADDFYEVILAALNEAKSAIVIWTKDSAKSNFVRDEARFALFKKKFIATKTADLDVYDIPFGFQGQHTEIVTERDKIARAVEKLGAKARPAQVASPSSAPQSGSPQANVASSASAAPDASAWTSVKDSNATEPLLAFVERYPDSAHRCEALQRVRQLVTEGPIKTKDQKSLGFLRMSNWSAFLSGLTFGVPEFQPTAQGTWSSIGWSVGALILLGCGFAVTGYVGNTMLESGWPEEQRGLITAMLFFDVFTYWLVQL